MLKIGREGFEVVDGSNGFVMFLIGGLNIFSGMNGLLGIVSNVDVMDIDGFIFNFLVLN